MRHSLAYVRYRAGRLSPGRLLGAIGRRGGRLLAALAAEGRAHLLPAGAGERALRRALLPGAGEAGPTGFFVEPGMRAALTARLRREQPEAPAGILAAAEALLAHRFDLLGSGPTPLGEPIDWHRDFKSGHRFPPRRFAPRIRYGQLPGVDVKVPWELSRFQHLPTLGKAYWLTGDGRYAAEGLGQIRHWIGENPPPFGVNWVCTMDVAIRAFNWLWGFGFLGGAADPAFRRLLQGSLLSHGRHILAHLERGADGISSNHYLSDLIGLFALGLACPGFREAEGWRGLALAELVREMERQVHPDGGDYESSLPYHRLVTEIFLAAALLCRRRGLALPEAYLARLGRMLEFVRWYTKPNGLAPQVGDADDGRLHILAGYGGWDPRDHRHLLAAGGAFLGRPELSAAGTGPGREEALWLLPEVPASPPASPPAPPGSRAFTESGIYLLREGELYALVSCGAVGTRGIGNHKHNDLLSLEVHSGGQDLLVDPGSYLYTPDPAARNAFRSTAAHNTVMVDGEEQNRFGEGGLFWLHADAAPGGVAFRAGDEAVEFAGEHDGYRRLADPVIHRREVTLRRRERRLEIVDTLTGAGRHRLVWNFTLAPGVEARPAGAGAWELSAGAVRAHLALTAVEPAGRAAQIATERVEAWVSPGYGRRERSAALRFTAELPLPLRCRFVLGLG